MTKEKLLEMENGCIRMSAGPQSFPASPKNYVYDRALNDLGSGTRGPVTSQLPKTMEIIMFSMISGVGQGPPSPPAS